jgi:hypothetical protein
MLGFIRNAHEAAQVDRSSGAGGLLDGQVGRRAEEAVQVERLGFAAGGWWRLLGGRTVRAFQIRVWEITAGIVSIRIRHQAASFPRYLKRLLKIK